METQTNTESQTSGEFCDGRWSVQGLKEWASESVFMGLNPGSTTDCELYRPYL